MPYSPQTWVDGNASYPLSAARMSNIETGLQTAAGVADQGHRILTTVQRDALGAVTAGTMIYNSTLGELQIYAGSVWVTLYSSSKPSAYNSVARIAYTQRTTNYTVSSTTVAGATDVFTGGGATGAALTWTAAGSTAYRVEFYAPVVQTGATAGSYIVVNLVDGAGNDLGGLAETGYGSGQVVQVPNHVVYYYTPAAGSTTINVRAYRAVANGTIACGVGGSGARIPMWLAVFGPPLA